MTGTLTLYEEKNKKNILGDSYMLDHILREICRFDDMWYKNAASITQNP